MPIKTNKRYERLRIENISEADFWSAWTTRTRALREACALGRSGKTGAAYKALADFHRSVSDGDWTHAVEDAERRNSDRTARRRTFARASDVLRGRIRVWQEHTVDFGPRIDFNANVGRFGLHGFHYMRWLTPLVDRYILNRNSGDLARIIDIVQQYYAQRTQIVRRIPSLHPVYYELGAWAKTEVLLPAYLALIHTGTPDGKTVEAFLKLFLGFGRSLRLCQRNGYRAGNWQIVGAAALYRLGATFPHLREAAAWRRCALMFQKLHLQRDFYSDGGHKERCWSYGWMSLEGVVRFYELGIRTRLLSKQDAVLFRRVIRRAFAWFVKTMAPGEVLCAYGDGDLASAAPVLKTAAAYVPNLDEQKKRRSSICLRASGYTVMRDTADDTSRYLNVNFGASGGWHTHDDLLDFNIWAFGDPIIEEVGRFDSYDQPLHPFFRCAEAHNQIVIDHHPMRRNEASGRDVRWFQAREIDYFSAWHDAFRHPREGNVVGRIHRHVLFVRGAYWVVYDVIEPVNDAIFSASSYLHSPRRFKRAGRGRAVVSGRVGAVIDFAFRGELRRLEIGTDIAKREVTATRLHPERFFLRARKWATAGGNGCLRFAMLVYPFRGNRPRVRLNPIKMRGTEPGGAEAFEVCLPTGRHVLVFNQGDKKKLLIGRRKVNGRVMWSDGRKTVSVP